MPLRRLIIDISPNDSLFDLAIQTSESGVVQHEGISKAELQKIVLEAIQYAVFTLE